MAEAGTYGHQSDLAPLPVPQLSTTLEKYLKTVRPLLSDEEYEHTQAVVMNFKAREGVKLQEMLEERKNKVNSL